MASIDDRDELSGAVLHRSGAYRVTNEGLDECLVLERQQAVTRDALHESGRGIAYTKPAFALVFTRTS
jgi:hypothetical protein